MEREKLQKKLQKKKKKVSDFNEATDMLKKELEKPYTELTPELQNALKQKWIKEKLDEIRKHLDIIKIIKRSNNDFNEIQSNIDSIKEIFKNINLESDGMFKNFLNEVKTKRIELAMNIFNKSEADKIDFHFFSPKGLNKIMEIIKLPDHKLQVKNFNLNLNEKKITDKDSEFTIATTEDDITEVQIPPVSHQFLEEITMDNKMLFNIDKYIEFKLIDDLPKATFSFGKKKMSHCNGKSIPINLKLYNSIKSRVKRKVKRWPSAYASGQLVRMYKQKGGKYRCSKFGSLDRWFKEKWVDVCTGKVCGRKKIGDKRKYPYCRPSRRISKQTPRTSKELSKKEIKRRCVLKHRLKGKTMKFGKKKKSTDLTQVKLILSEIKYLLII